MVGRRVRVLLSALSTVRVAIVGAIVGAVVVVAVPVWGLVAGPSAVSPQLGFTHVPACVVVDTSITGGAFVVPTSPPRDYVVTGNGDFSAQGGSATGCGVPEGVAGVFFNLKTKWVSGKGRVEVYEAGGTATGAPLVNFDESSFKDNAGATTMLCTGICSADFTVSVLSQAAASTHVVVTVLGYFTEANERTIFVNGGGTKEDNGTALTNALAAIPTTGPDIPSDINPWLIKLEPGTFDLGTVSIGLVLPGHVHLEGSGKDVSTIKCACSSEIVRSTGVTQIRDVTILNSGSSAIGNYHGIRRESTLEVTNSRIESTGDGIANFIDGPLVVEGSTVISNDRTGIVNRGSATIRGSHIESTGTFGAGSSGINADGTIVVEGSTVISNEGHGIINGGSATIRDSHIESTGSVSPPGSSGDHGIINGTDDTLVVEGSTVKSNKGAGIHNRGSVTIKNSHIEATGTGDTDYGIHNNADDTLAAERSTVISNEANGIHNEGSATITDSHVESTGTGDTDHGIHNDADKTLVVEGSTVISNEGKGIHNFGSATIRNSRIESTGTGQGDDGIWNNADGTLAVNRTTVISNEGRGIGNDRSATIEDSHIESTGTTAGDVGIHNNPDDTLVVNRSTVTSNAGFGIQNYGSATINGSHIESNEATGIFNEGSATIRDSHVESTGTDDTGYGINNNPDDTLVVEGSTVISNAGIGVYNQGSATIRSSRVESKGGDDGDYGIQNGVADVNDKELVVEGSTVISKEGVGIVDFGSATIEDSRIESTGTGVLDQGIYNHTGQTLDVIRSTVISNAAAGIANNGSLTAANTTIDAPVHVSGAGTSTCHAVTYWGTSFNATGCP